MQLDKPVETPNLRENSYGNKKSNQKVSIQKIVDQEDSQQKERNQKNCNEEERQQKSIREEEQFQSQIWKGCGQERRA